MLQPLAQNIIYGILIGALYGLAAVGLSLVFGVSKFLNVSHGELLMLGGYASFWVFKLLKIDPFLSIPLTIIFLLLIGFIFYRLIFSRLIKLEVEKKIQNSLLVGFGLSTILQNVALRLWTADDRSITTAYSGLSFELAGLRLPAVRLISLAISVVALISLQIFLKKTFTGKAIRATVEDWQSASLMGINIHRVYLLAFVIGCALAGVAGTLVSICYSIDPSMGLNWTLKSMVVMVLGGLGSMIGTFVGGIILGVTESATAFFIGGNYRLIAGLLLFLIILIFRPQGLFGTKEGDR
ncbi:MAG: branched-chain amino acid ABC transporter permease [Chloroflexi bacterium]|jgi:branched-chain amino acid transport system permease protein|nr:branched-chain amino acid ABC transporter permease [Anaerolineaceae bacterium]NLI44994.1 branched-chain amino acid ABC transporter permease [Chloroflexota bacterium]HOT24816.1 branched-chain amino acid ABC transporter permease [Anaerolineaceae bacterium]HQH57585.1 branched-chain amino acid ABC transporter permease [Anaerolineaceae bacterium]HQK03143.1 branched-chain amino acid ABC transporter permease [Anaerolineaceae bacterium]